MTAPALVLFDIDGTLITSGGAGTRSWRYAFEQLHGIPADIGSHSGAGETDPVVTRKTFEGAIGREPTERELAAIFVVRLPQLSHEVATSEGSLDDPATAPHPIDPVRSPVSGVAAPPSGRRLGSES